MASTIFCPIESSFNKISVTARPPSFQFQQNNKSEIDRIITEWLEENPGKTRDDVPKDVIRFALDVQKSSVHDELEADFGLYELYYECSSYPTAQPVS